MDIRRAVAGDAVAIATVHVRSWQGSFPGLIPQDYLDALRPEHRLAEWEHTLAATRWPQRGTFVLLGRVGPDRAGEDAVVGFVSISPSRDADADGATGEVQTIYLDPDAVGSGAGRMLMGAALDEFRRAGFRSATLWVLETNARARRFYERQGWKPDGASKLHDWGSFSATDVRYAIALG
jgi:ribosomal protein S18 acetylase RimI-like enzyme